MDTKPTSLSQSAETSHKFLSFFEANAKRESFVSFASSQKISIPFIYIITLRVYNIKMASTVRCFIVDAFWSLAFLFYCARALKRFSSNGWGFVPSRGPLREAFPDFFFFLCCLRGWIRENAREGRGVTEFFISGKTTRKSNEQRMRRNTDQRFSNRKCSYLSLASLPRYVFASPVVGCFTMMGDDDFR